MDIALRDELIFLGVYMVGVLLITKIIEILLSAKICLPVRFGCFKWSGLEAQGAEVVILTVVDVGHRLIFETLGQLCQSSLRWRGGHRAPC